MARNLLEAIQQGQAAMQPIVPEAGQTEQARRLLLAKGGKAIQPGGIRQSALGEAVARGQAGAQIQAMAPAIEMARVEQQQRAEGLQAEEEAGRADIAQKKRAADLQMTIETNQTLRQLNEERRKLDFDKDKAQLEQLARGLALQDRKYTDQLQREGAMQRLDQGKNFDLAYQRAALGADLDLLNQVLKGDSLAGAKRRDIAAIQASMDLDSALKIAQGEMNRQAIASKWGGIGQLTTAGISAYGQYAGGRPAASPAETPPPIPQSTRSLGATLDSEEA
jgi:hypothetical protein